MQRTQRIIRLLVPMLILWASGCAAIANPVADGIPVSRLPVEVLGRSKLDLKPIPLTALRQREQEFYLLDKGDILAIVADDVIAPSGQQVPVNLPDQTRQNGSVGFPIPVSDDGNISIPRLKPIKAAGKTIAEVEQAIKDSASGKFGGPVLINPEIARVTVQLLQKRTYSITVVREDTQPALASGAGGALVGGNKRGNGFTIRLQAGENDVLRALNMTGGPPGLDAKDEVLIFRGNNPEPIRIPLRIYAEQSLSVRETDIMLKDGDVLKIESRDTSQEIFYLAGVPGSRQFPLPRDYDLDVIQALTLASANLASGGFAPTSFVANSVAAGLGSPSPALLTVLRQLPNGNQIPIRVDLNRALRDPRERIRVQGGDILVMQERPGDAITRYITQTFRFALTGNIIQGERDVGLIGTGSIP